MSPAPGEALLMAHTVGQARARIGARLLVVVLLMLAVTAFLRSIRAEVDRHIVENAGPWRFSDMHLPQWFPPDYQGELARLEELPADIELRSSVWRDELRAAMEANPWLASVESLQRVDGRILFDATFVRPLVAVRASDGFLLVASSGHVIDFVSGDRVSDSWGIPEYYPVRGAVPRLDSGVSLLVEEDLLTDGDRDEFHQLMALVEPLGEAGIFDRFAGAIREVYVDHKRDRDRFWILLLPQGTRLEWGRSPASKYPQTLDTAAKLANLEEVLHVWRDLSARNVVLWVGEGALVEES